MEEIIKKHAKILDDKKAQTTNKIKYVSKYVENWLYVMANAKFSEGINFIDCMCNAGIYLDGDFCTSIEVLKLFVASAAIHKDKTFNLYFNDYMVSFLVLLTKFNYLFCLFIEKLFMLFIGRHFFVVM